MIKNQKKNAARVTALLLMISMAINTTLIIASLFGCGHKRDLSVESATNSTEQKIFPKGNIGPVSNFTGHACNYGLVADDTTYHTLVGNVYFERGSRSNWHTHPGGQILIILDGEGYHQIEGQPRQKMTKGDVVKCPPNAKHWHGATENNSLSQMYIVPNTDKGIVTWLEPVIDAQYQSNH